MLLDLIKKQNEERTYPSYGEVIVTLGKDISKAFKAYEVLYVANSDKFAQAGAENFLKKLASKYKWDYSSMIDIISDEYTCIYYK